MPQHSWLLQLALTSAKTLPPFLPGLLAKAALTGGAAWVVAPAGERRRRVLP
jgi:hypothetical protein